MNTPSVIAKKHKLSLRRLEIDLSKLLKPVSKGIIAAASKDWKGAYINFIDTIDALGLSKTAEDHAWDLIYKSTTKAIYELIEESIPHSNKTDQELYELLQTITHSIEIHEPIIDLNFFSNPRTFQNLPDISSNLRQWLTTIGIEDHKAQSVSNRFPRYFAKALYDEWNKNKEKYKCILDALDSPFNEALRNELDWKRYFSWLQRQPYEPMMEEMFGIASIYIPLRAYYSARETKKEFSEARAECEVANAISCKNNIVIDLESAILKWLNDRDKKDAIRIICGGPGCGKSSFAKILTAKLAEAERKTIFIPLHMIDANEDLSKTIGNFMQRGGWLTYNPVDTENDDFIVILDGLDELAMQGRTGIEAARCFLGHATRTLSIVNQEKLRLQLIITGRDLAVQATESEFRLKDATLHILPYIVTDQIKFHEQLSDPEKLLEIDQRNAWWELYGNATGKNYKELPVELKTEKLEEITSQPLLNYLIALTYDKGNIHFSSTNMNTIYNKLLNDVYERAWADERRPWVGELTHEEFYLILEEISVSVWHGDGRKTSIDEIKTHCNNSKLLTVLDKFQDGVEKGLIRLLTAFYFRKAISRGETETFEFTHKSFGEYLVSRHITRTATNIHKDYSKNKSGYSPTWNEKIALEYWCSQYGHKEMDRYLYSFLEDEFCTIPVPTVKKWQKMFCHLISFFLQHGMPMEKLSGLSFQEQCRQARNAEEIMLASLNACSKNSTTISNIAWPLPTSFGEWLARLQPQRNSPESTLGYSCLNNISANNQQLPMVDLYSSNLAKSSLKNCQLFNANFMFSNLSEVNFNGAKLDDVEFANAILNKTNFESASLRESNFTNAICNNANFKKARMEKSNLHKATLINTNFEKADLTNTNFSEASLEGANLSNSKLKEANLTRANLCDANLVGANLSGSDLSKANFNKANLANANLLNCKFNFSKFLGANLDNAKFDDDVDIDLLTNQKRCQ
ncbi:pentapeptide repeat-containing protein [Solidesulfovibrio magneticus]|uniref:NACHT N-terminal Helical domain-containing protein n=1 Tax=Solidesulfovibrio magneticus (strain ATCC 700980 / DSM 13731 / RS-1) TaxID=573370 RepID=C4XQY5_SOLM1|nr:pentapeptide repeat-containing protein [Solidesulfovibrio magneticus]BAH77865.1 hypothetical protein DMR_43740 [Solidesulfovibrio magneticus RS-1]